MKKNIETKTEVKKVNNKVVEGIVVSNKMQKTIVVKVTTRRAHPKYKKIVTTSTKFKAHVEDGIEMPVIGAKVKIQQHKPISKDKNWILVNK
jgi:small subunit ribosomal protein S17